jgi:polar amino acid transport system substrate-binding protein
MMIKTLIGIIGVAGLAPLFGMQQLPSDARSELAPTGRLRVGINYGNALLAGKDASGNPRGIAVDLAKELAKRLAIAIEIVSYENAGRLADAAKAGAWDVAFLGADPDRATEIAFTPPYLEIDTTYLVPAGSSIKSLEDVDRDGVRIAVSEKSAYDLFLSRTIKRARLIRIPGADASVDMFFSQRLDALAGLRPILIDASKRQPGSRVLDGRFTVVQQAVGTPIQRQAAAKYLNEFVANIKVSGLVAQMIQSNQVSGVSVAP